MIESLLGVAASAVRALPAETAHRATVKALSLATPFLSKPADDPRLGVHAVGLNFPNPIGIAAGFDKNGEAPEAILRLGFGFAECGTVTPKPQEGNPRPRVFRLPEDRAVINRLGFNNEGMKKAALRLAHAKRAGIVGINIGANKDATDRIADYIMTFKTLAPLASYVTVNISSPNTPGLRGLQNRGDLERLLSALLQARGTNGPPLLVKIAPDLDEAALDAIAEVCLAAKIEGLIVSNTTIARPDTLRSPNRTESGGLSGAPLFAPSTAILKAMRARVGAKMVLIGVGGVSSGADAYAKIRAGASLVQLYTALVYQGPGLVARMKRDLLALMERDGFTNITAAIGADQH